MQRSAHPVRVIVRGAAGPAAVAAALFLLLFFLFFAFRGPGGRHHTPAPDAGTATARPSAAAPPADGADTAAHAAVTSMAEPRPSTSPFSDRIDRYPNWARGA